MRAISQAFGSPTKCCSQRPKILSTPHSTVSLRYFPHGSIPLSQPAFAQVAQHRPTNCPASVRTLQRSIHTTAIRNNGSPPTTALFQASDLTMDEYHKLSDKALDDLLLFFEDAFEFESEAGDGWDVDYNSGVLTVNFGKKHGIYVLNKQPPNKQIWLSSPMSGPKRYDFDVRKGVWFYHRDQRTLGTLLREELSRILRRDPDLIVLPLA
ncbi:uncharacterized protein EI90DRAFT_3152035 [Cantharellus anzutake]|uniref:uncharacterized protein n=1 Tax=Cantharellus anzutake TaxID=1750568 RepID=UPI0019038707|nr:uncharacterized protein EI90DRAFT_3152035 [Cantharellus anzutake]KAF8338316.1 hypothetical protein EI90DRAFT_3152035 [Cantharellus anzutake]